MPGVRRRAALAALALQPGRAVSSERLIEMVWDGSAPATAGNSLQAHVSYLRRELGLRDVLLARAPGYVLDLEPSEVDAALCERLIAGEPAGEEPAARARRLRTALGLWRDRPLADLPGLSWVDGEVERLERLRRIAIHGLAEARLALGEHAELIPELTGLTARYPTDERLVGLLMTALHRDGRRGEARAVYQKVKEPGRRLRELAAQQDPLVPVPAQLPPATAAFAGREVELSRLDALLESGRFRIALSGTAGVGKTTLAVHWAQRQAHRFPDGRLYADLRGFSPAGAVADPSEPLRGFLEAFGVAPQRIPSGLDAQARLFRKTVAGRRVLILLDNARDAAQIQPLLPGADETGCLVLITSRAVVGEDGVRLELLAEPDAQHLFVARLGRERVAREPEAAAALIARCAGLPLALAIVAARAASSPRVPLASLAGEMAEAESALDLLDGGDPISNVRAVFSWSFGALGRDAARLFGYLGNHPGPEISATAAASMAGMSAGAARVLLAELVAANLLIERAEGRYSLHDLLRAYAGEQGVEDQSGALERMCAHYLHTAHRAAILLGSDHPIPLGAAPPGVTVEALDDYRSAMRWFDAERQTLVEVAKRALDNGLHEQVWQLAWTMRVYLSYQGLWQWQSSVQSAAVAAAQRLDDPYALAHALRGLAYADSALDRHDDACAHVRRAVECFAEAQRLPEQALSLLSLARLLDSRGDSDQALKHAHEALEIYRATDYDYGVAYALNAIGWCHGRLADYQAGLDHCHRALGLHRSLGNQEGESFTLDSLGYIYHHLRDFPKAIIRYREALALFQERADRSSEAETSERLGDSLHATGDPAAARQTWLRALELVEQVREPDHPDGARLRRKLAP